MIDLEAGPLAQSNLTNDLEPVLVTLKCESTKEMLVTWAKAEVTSVPTSIPNGKEVVSVSVPQEKRPADQVSLPVEALQVERPAPLYVAGVIPLAMDKEPPKLLEEVELPIEA